MVRQHSKGQGGKQKVWLSKTTSAVTGSTVYVHSTQLARLKVKVCTYIEHVRIHSTHLGRSEV